MGTILMLILTFASTIPSATGWLGQETVPDFASLCPLNNFCETSSVVQNGTDRFIGSCCQKCSCDSSCYTVGTCCPGVEHLVPKNTQNTTPRYACVSPNQLMNIARNLTSSSSGYKYRIVDRCPDDTSQQFPNCENPKTIFDYVIVSDTASDYVFKNKHCAACHAINEVIDWTLSIKSCAELMTTSFKSVRDRNDYILKHCEFDARPPESTDVEVASCYGDINFISKCNVSMKWDVYDKALEEACLQERPLLNTIFKKRALAPGWSVKYTNVYCYLCNINKSQHQGTKHTLCDRERPIAEKGSHRPKFTALLDLSQFNHDDQVSKSSRCEAADMWDTFSDICRPTHCPLGKIPVHGKCVDFAISASGYSLLLVFDIELNTGNFTTLLDGRTLLEELLLKMIPRECTLCQTDLYHVNDASTFKTAIVFHTTDHCSVSKVSMHIKSLVMKEPLNRYLDNTIHISLRLSMDNLTSMERIVDYITTKKHCNNPLKIELHHLQNCQRILISIEEFTNLGFNISLIETHDDMKILVDYARNIVSVCVGKYFQLRQAMSKSHARNWDSDIVNFVIVALCILFSFSTE